MRAWKYAFDQALKAGLVGCAAVLTGSLSVYWVECGFEMPPQEYLGRLALRIAITFGVIVVVATPYTRWELWKNNQRRVS
jgi:hypothetical protein